MVVYRKILVAYDGSSYSKKALQKATEFMDADKRVETHVVHVSDLPRMDMFSLYGHSLSQELIQEMDEANEKTIEEAKEIMGKYKEDCYFERLQGDVAQELIDYADKHELELMLIGSRGLGVFKGMVLGSVSSRVVQHADCHVLIIK